jgi:hypothetical protein
VIGAIAEQRMSAEAKAYVAGVLGLEPLALSATWADSVRDDERFGHNENDYDRNRKDADDFNFSTYHFIDLPAGFTYDTRPNHDLKDSFGAIRGSLAILQDAKAKPAEKMIALRYLIHMVGDIHQPLHVGNWHDVGGNFCQVYYKESKEPKNLHAVWDANLIEDLGLSLKNSSDPKASPPYYPEFVALLKQLRADEFNAPKPTDVSLSAIKSWIDESANLRDNKANRAIGVYPEKAGQMNQYPGTEYMHRSYCMWFSDSKNGVFGDTSPRNKKDIPDSAIPRLDAEYVNVNLKVVERQVMTAGIRLAAVLDDLALKTSKECSLPPPQQQSIIKTIQSLFHNPVQ